MELLPGLIQGITRVTISYPFDTVKLYMQKNIYKNTYETVKEIIRRDIRILYRGSTLSYIMIPIDRSIQFYVMERYKKELNPIIISIGCGIMTGIYNIPLQYMTGNILLEREYRGMMDKIKKMEIKEMYKGVSVELPRTVISTMSYMGSYYIMRDKYNRENNNYKTMMIGMTSSIICWMIMYPLDTIRNDYQTERKILLREIIWRRYREYGIKNFYKGISAVIIRTIPSSTLGMLSYEITRKIINKNDINKIK